MKWTNDLQAVLDQAMSGNVANLDTLQPASKSEGKALEKGNILNGFSRSEWSLNRGDVLTQRLNNANSVPILHNQKGTIINSRQNGLNNFKRNFGSVKPTTYRPDMVLKSGNSQINNSISHLESGSIPIKGIKVDIENNFIPHNKDSILNSPNGSPRATGVHIPIETVLRAKRQAISDSLNRRVFLLMNPKTPNATVDINTLTGSALMITPKDNKTETHTSNSTIDYLNFVSVENFNNLRDILEAVQKENAYIPPAVLSEVLQSQPAMQRISDLSAVDISSLVNDNKTLENSSNGGGPNKITLTTDQLRVLLQALLAGNEGTKSQRVSDTAPTNIPGQVSTRPVQTLSPIQNQQQQQQTTRRQESSATNNAGNVRNRSTQQETRSVSNNNNNNINSQNIHALNQAVRRNLQRQQTSRQIPQTSSRTLGIPTPQPRRTVPSRNQNALVQIVRQSGSTNLRQLQTNPTRVQNTRLQPQRRMTVQSPTSSQRIRQATTSRGSSAGRPLVRAISSRTGSTSSRVGQPSQRGVIQQRGTTSQRQGSSTRQQNVQRRPPDPFTSRFQVGFQRGSNLLAQPDMDFTGFDGSVRENVGFNMNMMPPPGPGGRPPPNMPPFFRGGPGPRFFGPTIV
ncbi:myb-like protein I [Mya arenaria]|uniref:myb-like protein I n=1 Tax=Mya arenaria TaxID=6604 RepID=UPI0022DF706A|nr:myb-like protein I [Mya arenaria]